jgi:23S rRNA (adenine2503-C2)-methyltransferase
MRKSFLAAATYDSLSLLLPSLPAFRIRQIITGIAAGVSSFDAMTSLPLDLRAELARQFTLRGSSVVTELRDDDGTVKLQIRLYDGALIEAVLLIDGGGRKTACVSTQAGCPVSCVFCKTGSLGFKRNLEAAEMVEQFFYLRAIHGDLDSIVVMGMGEPFLNMANLRLAIAALTAPSGICFSHRRITVSTSGIAAGIRALAEDGPDIRLAVSLTTADGGLRSRLMPALRDNPLPLLKEALLFYREKKGRRVTLEAVLLKGINTRTADVDALAAFARGLDVVVNLIPWNAVPGMRFEGQPLYPPSPAEVSGFAAGLERRGLKALIRREKGRSVCGACGQLG